MSTLATAATCDLLSYGRVWSLARGAYGAILALAWENGKVRSSQGRGHTCALGFDLNEDLEDDDQ